MKLRRFRSLTMVFLAFFLSAGGRQTSNKGSKVYALDTTNDIELINTKAEVATYRGRKAVHLIDLPGQAKDSVAGGNTLAVLTGTDFENGTIDVDVAGAPRAGAVEAARGFIGIAFRVQSDLKNFDCFYVRPTNGRAEDQLRRNHSTQYIAEPEYPWERLRSEAPGLFESYVDLEPGAWTHLKVEVTGTKARLYVNRAEQPTLIVSDMKHSENHGKIALWIGLDTDGYFSYLTIK